MDGFTSNINEWLGSGYTVWDNYQPFNKRRREYVFAIVWDGGWRITCKEENYIELTRKRDGNIITCWAYDDGTIYLAWYDGEVELIDLQVV